MEINKKITDKKKKFFSNKTYTKKKYFKEYYDLINKFIFSEKIESILDIGCASGFLFKYLKKDIKCLGIDISKSLVIKASKENKNKKISFKQLNLFLKNNKLGQIIKKNRLKGYDLVTFLGTMGLLPDYMLTVKRLIQLKPKKIIIHTLLNRSELDVKIYYRKNGYDKQKMAYNIPSVHNISKLFNRFNYQTKFIPYVMKKRLVRNKKEKFRNYHLQLKNGKKILTNDMGMIHSEFIIIASKK